MLSLGYLHIIAFLVILINFLIFNKRFVNNLGSKYFLINYIYHNYKNISCFIIMYPFVIILIYFLVERIVPFTTFFISILHVYFLEERLSKIGLFKFEILFFVSLVIETEVMYELILAFSKTN